MSHMFFYINKLSKKLNIFNDNLFVMPTDIWFSNVKNENFEVLTIRYNIVDDKIHIAEILAGDTKVDFCDIFKFGRDMLVLNIESYEQFVKDIKDHFAEYPCSKDSLFNDLINKYDCEYHTYICSKYNFDPLIPSDTHPYVMYEKLLSLTDGNLYLHE